MSGATSGLAIRSLHVPSVMRATRPAIGRRISWRLLDRGGSHFVAVPVSVPAGLSAGTVVTITPPDSQKRHLPGAPEIGFLALLQPTRSNDNETLCDRT